MPKFKNYKNKYTNNNIIHTTDDLMRMTLSEMTSREPELRSQYKQIGLPTRREMHNSSNVVYVNGYTKSDGTQVRGYWRSKGEGSIATTNQPNSGPSIIGQAPELPKEEEPTVIFDEKYPDYPIEEKPDNTMELPSLSNNLVLEGGVSIDDTLPSVGVGGWIGNIISAVIQTLPFVSEIVSQILGNSSTNIDEIKNISDNNIRQSQQVPTIQNFNTKDIKVVEHQNINPKEFIQKFVSSMRQDKSDMKANDESRLEKQVSVNNIPNEKNIKSDKNQAIIPVSNTVKTTVPVAQQNIQFEPINTENSTTISHSLEPLSSNIQDYINDLLKSEQSKSRNDLNTKINDFIRKYNPARNEVNNFEKCWIPPVDLNVYKISSPYGWRIHPIFHTKKFHDGVDVNTPNNTIIKSVADGTVVRADWYNGYGKYVEIKHIDGTKSFYGHLSKIDVQPGQIVKQGQVIGRSGNTGYSTGPHLHWGARDIKGKPIDPRVIIRNK